jgi:hypothetical protein
MICCVPVLRYAHRQAGSPYEPSPLPRARAGFSLAFLGDPLPSEPRLCDLRPNGVLRLAFYELRKKIQLQGIDAHDNRIVGNFLGTNASGTYHDVAHVAAGSASGVQLINGASNNLIGGTSAADRNVISGNSSQGVALYDAGTDQNVIKGNVIGLTPSGGGRLTNLGVDINYGASRNVVGGTLQGERNVISGNGREGVEISHHSNTFPTGNRVIGNFVGTNLTGQTAPGYAHNGSGNLDAVHLVDGATDSFVANNVIGNANQSGVGIDGTDGSQTKGNRVYANRIGVSSSGAAIPNGVAGIMIYAGARESIIGPDNRIANNPVGVRVIGSNTRPTTITSNQIYQNTGLGIDLGSFGPTPNDPKDADSGPNGLQNKPAIGSALTSGGTTRIHGTLNTMPSKAFVVRLFSNPRGTNEGKNFIGRRAVTTGADGKASFTFRTAAAVRPGRTVTATATAPSGDTSEFSVARTVKRP